MARVIKTLEYSIADVVPYINWLYFFHAWGLSGKPDAEKNALREEAMQMLASMEPRYATHAVFGLFDANADGDDIIIDGLRFPMLRQQTPTEWKPHAVSCRLHTSAFSRRDRHHRRLCSHRGQVDGNRL